MKSDDVEWKVEISAFVSDPQNQNRVGFGGFMN
jgi:hypothetical protein